MGSQCVFVCSSHIPLCEWYANKLSYMSHQWTIKMDAFFLLCATKTRMITMHPQEAFCNVYCIYIRNNGDWRKQKQWKKYNYDLHILSQFFLYVCNDWVPLTVFILEFLLYRFYVENYLFRDFKQNHKYKTKHLVWFWRGFRVLCFLCSFLLFILISHSLFYTACSLFQ